MRIEAPSLAALMIAVGLTCSISAPALAKKESIAATPEAKAPVPKNTEASSMNFAKIPWDAYRMNVKVGTMNAEACKSHGGNIELMSFSWGKKQACHLPDKDGPATR